MKKTVRGKCSSQEADMKATGACRDSSISVKFQETSLLSSLLLFVPAVPCQLNLTGPEGYIEAPPQSSSAFHSTLDCSYTITVYMGYGVEVQVGARRTSTPPCIRCSLDQQVKCRGKFAFNKLTTVITGAPRNTGFRWGKILFFSSSLHRGQCANTHG